MIFSSGSCSISKAYRNNFFILSFSFGRSFSFGSKRAGAYLRVVKLYPEDIAAERIFKFVKTPYRYYSSNFEKQYSSNFSQRMKIRQIRKKNTNTPLTSHWATASFGGDGGRGDGFLFRDGLLYEGARLFEQMRYAEDGL